MDIVVGALSGMVDALPLKLGELLEQEYALLSGVRGDVVFLQSELSSMRAAIRHCESLDHPDAQTGTWVGRVRELAYDIEDWVDLFGIRVDGGAGPDAAGSPASVTSRFLGWLRRGAKKLATMPDRHVIANELKELKERVIELSEQRKRYACALPVPAAFRPVDPRLAALFVDPSSLVGLKEPVEDVSKMVMDTGSRTELKVVSIVGMAGAGKTTLANAVLKRLEAQETFDCRAFVSVGQKPETINKVLADMLWKLGGEHQGIEDISHLIGRLRDILKEKRYLVVVDDLWSSNHWTTMKCCWPENSLGSRIITTTRNAALARECSSGSDKCIYKIGFLSNEDAKNLFLKKAFGNGHGCPKHLVDVFDQTVNRCGGLPLAVVSRAGMLAHKQSRDDWERLGLNSLSSSHPDGVKQILNLSYNDLLPQLRTCLLYLSIFPENFEVDTERLMRRWIAEGFISGARGISIEGTARSYLNELISKSLVQPLHLNHEHFPRYCRVHPVIYDFIVCKSKEENFATLVDAQQQYVPNNNSTIRRLFLNSSKQDEPAARNEHMDLSHARSITVFGNAGATPLMTDLKVVRVLDLEGCKGPVCLDGLCKLLLLRYLSLGADINELPATIGELKWLQTLDVKSTKVMEIPSSIVKLEKLTHLLAGSARLPGRLAEMKSLQMLSCSANCLEQLRELTNVSKLELICSDETEMQGDDRRVTFPSDGLNGVKSLCIRGNSPSMTFEAGTLPDVQVLELILKKGLDDKSSSVSGIQHLSSLKHVYLEFSEDDAGAMATMDAMRKEAEVNHPEVTIMLNGKSY